MVKVLYITNIPSPYRVDYYNELSKYVDLTVIFEARRAEGVRFNWNDNSIRFNAIFLSHGEINENKVSWSIKRYLKHPYDYVVVTNYYCFTELFSIMYLQRELIAYYLEIDGALLNKETKALYYLKNKIKNKIISKAALCFSPSRASDLYLKNYGAKQTAIIRYPFTSLRSTDILDEPVSDTRKHEARKRVGIIENRIVLSVGQFVHRKGFDVLLKCAGNLGSNIGVYFVGGEPTQEYISLQKSLRLSNVHFIRFQSKERLIDYYQAADVFVLPTRGDTWGLVINEAMANGLPVISTDRCNAALELIDEGKNGFVVPVDDENLLERRIISLLCNDEKRAQFGKQSIEKIQNYTVEKMVESHMRYFT